MKVFRNLDHIAIEHPVATIGIFDGVHKAHRAVIDRLKSIAENTFGQSVMLTFWPHPRIVLQPGNDSLKLLNTLEEKITLLEDVGLDNLIVLPFDKAFAAIEFEEFVKNILVSTLQIEHLVVGFNHQFGKNREGNYEKLQLLSDQYNFGLTQFEPFSIDNERISSSMIRKFILNGDIAKANEYLGYRFFLSGRIVRGSMRGRDIGFPTANILPGDTHKILPENGVYAVYVDVKGEIFQGMMNIGCRPTIYINCDQVVPEVNLFDYSGDLYDEEIKVTFIQRIRKEQKFQNLQDLASQITRDKVLVKDILASVKKKEN